VASITLFSLLQYLKTNLKLILSQFFPFFPPRLSTYVMYIFLYSNICRAIRFQSQYSGVCFFLFCDQPDDDHVWSKHIAGLGTEIYCVWAGFILHLWLSRNKTGINCLNIENYKYRVSSQSAAACTRGEVPPDSQAFGQSNVAPIAGALGHCHNRLSGFNPQTSI
jgi:hypothetical protein